MSSDAPLRLARPVLSVSATALGLLWLAVLVHGLVERDRTVEAVAFAGLLLTIGLAVVIGRYQGRLQGLVETDPLTELANHRGFHDALGLGLAAAERRSEELAVVIVDLDDFKNVNDRHGHSRGDEVLVAVAEQIRSSIRSTDLAARIGGEEFALILPGAGTDLADKVAERVRAAVAQIQVDAQSLSCSSGFAVYPTDGRDGATLCRLADGAMYSAKRDGKDRVRHFDPERVRLDWSERQSDEILLALARPGALRPVFQPVVSLATGRLVGYEALARFPDMPDLPVHGLFAQARECGLGPRLEAAAVVAALEPLGRPPGTHLALNVSPSSLWSVELERVLPEDLSDLVIELTEHELFPEEDELAARLRELRNRGAKIAIDDTGAGHAGLKQLMSVKPDIVKLDRDLTRAIHTDPPRMALVESFVRFARRIGAVVCAEGIESLPDLTALANLDVEWGQGYALARPDAPWPSVSEPAVIRCQSALTEVMRSNAELATISAGDRDLEHLSARLAGAQSRRDLEDALALIAGELNAGKICLSVLHRASGVVETLAENGEGSGQPSFNLDDYPTTATVLNEQVATQVMIGDPGSDPGEAELLLRLGHRSLLMVPVVHRGESVGLIEAFRDLEEPWTRSEINRARIISNQFASAIDAFFLEADTRDEYSRPRPA